jgi:hypothetical protein
MEGYSQGGSSSGCRGGSHSGSGSGQFSYLRVSAPKSNDISNLLSNGINLGQLK